MNKMVKNVKKENNASQKNGEYQNFSTVLKPAKKSIKFATTSSKWQNNLLRRSANNGDIEGKIELHIKPEDHLKQAGLAVAEIKQKQIDSFDELENYKRILKKRKKRLLARILTVLMLLIIAPVMIFLGTIIIDKNYKHDFLGYSFYVVATHSMKPEIMPNDGVVLKKVTDAAVLKVGDDIGYINDDGEVVVHRIVKIIDTPSGSLQFEMKGINNPSSDQKRVNFEQIVGLRVHTLKVLGNILVFFRTVPGIILFFVMFSSVMAIFYFIFKITDNIQYVEHVE